MIADLSKIGDTAAHLMGALLLARVDARGDALDYRYDRCVPARARRR